MSKIYLVYKQTEIFNWNAVRAFHDEEKAKEYCKKQNKINKPEYDSYGYAEGLNHDYFEVELE